MAASRLASVALHFEGLEDLRVTRTQYHPLINVVVIGGTCRDLRRSAFHRDGGIRKEEKGLAGKAPRFEQRHTLARHVQ